MYIMEGIKESGQSPVSERHIVVSTPNPFQICGQGVIINHFLNLIERYPGCFDIRSNYNKDKARYDVVIKEVIQSQTQIRTLIECLCAHGFIDCTDRPKGYLTFIVHGRYNVQQTCVGYTLHKKQLVQSTNLTIFAPIGQPNCGVEISRINTNDIYKRVDTDLSRPTLAYKTLLEGSESLEIFKIINEYRKREGSSDIYQLSPDIRDDEISSAINLYIVSHPDKIGNREYLFNSTKRRANVMNHPLSYISGNVTSIHEKAMAYSKNPAAIFLDGPSVSLRIKFKNKHIRKDLPYITINLFSQNNADGTPDTMPTTNANIINISHSIIDAIKELMRIICCPERELEIKHNLKTQLNVIDGSCGTLEKQKCISPETLFEFETGVSDSLHETPFQITQEKEMEEQEMKQEGPSETQPITQEYSDIAEELTYLADVADVAEERMAKHNIKDNLTSNRWGKESISSISSQRGLQMSRAIPVPGNSTKINDELLIENLKYNGLRPSKRHRKFMKSNLAKRKGGTRLRIARHSQRRQRRNRLSTFRTRYRGRTRAKRNSRTRRRQQHNFSRTKRRKYVH